MVKNDKSQPVQAHLSVLPSVDGLLSLPEARALVERCSEAWVKEAARAALDDLRVSIRDGTICPDRATATGAAVGRMRERIEARLRPSLRRVINATGVILHTGLGRAPLPGAAMAQVTAVAEGYCNLEIDLESGERGERVSHVERLLCDLSGAEAAAVVNNNAAAVLLTLNTLASDREAVVSRGQLIEIGGSFRIPDVMGRGGARMVEVGTTNRTHLKDFREAITERTGLLLSVHPSNYRVTGFTAEVGLEDLVALGREFSVPVAHDLGGGVLVDLRPYGLPYEPLVSDSVRAGADVVTFSGDKVLGGPQAGVIVGRRKAVEAMRKNPLMRALRCDKLTYAALEATLRLYLRPAALLQEHPTLRMLTEPVATLRRRARRLIGRLKGLEGQVELRLEETVAYTGSGALPLEEIPSAAVTLRPVAGSVAGLARGLRMGEPAVVGYVREGRVWLDVRTVRDEEVRSVAEAVRKTVR
ncbi:MAG: L-seryl-tRNA(Sec) selenium transferase [Candidatus Latescibacteria bacterium]|nr:L-seryl-tRNA(Sec) selenium transferase [Candidatus Latescibacterota bacterium]